MGAVNKIPGVSGGTVAFITGIYEELIDSITKINFSSFKKLFKEGFISFYNEINGKFLFTVFGGLIASFFSVSLLLDLIMEKYELYIYGLFFGMIVGSFYVIYNKLEKLTFRTSTALIIGFIVGMIISFADKINLGSSELIIFISGVIAISGMILPGLSGSYLLLLMGNYTLIMVDSVNSLYFSIVDLFKLDFNFIYDDERVYLLKVLFLFTTGSIFGLISGYFHVTLKIPSFIATLATGGIAASLSLVITNASSVQILQKEKHYITWITDTSFYIPNEILVSLTILVLCSFLINFTKFGRYVTSIGAGEAVAWTSGIDVKLNKYLALILSASLAAISGIVLSSRMSAGSPTLANEFLLPAIAAVIIGGTALTGGVGSIQRTLIGVLIISVLRIGMTFIGINIFAQQLVFGCMLIIAVALNIDRSKIPIVK